MGQSLTQLFITDGKKEEVARKNDTTAAEVYLQLDVTDNLDAYLERERARKLNLSKTAEKTCIDDIKIKIEEDVDKDETLVDSEKDTSLNETVIPAKRSFAKLSTKDLTEGDSPNVKANTSKESFVVTPNQSPSIAEAKSNDEPKLITTIKSEPVDTDKKDNNRFIWVSNVDKTTKATSLKLHLGAFGKIQLAKIVTNGKECFGYVVMESHDDVVNCIKNLQNSIFEGKTITLSDKAPDKRQREKQQEVPSKDINKVVIKNEKQEVVKKQSQSIDSRDDRKSKSKTRSIYRKSPSSDPLTLRVGDRKQREYSEERRQMEDLERKRFAREQISAERRVFEFRKREIERERQREIERQKEREKELRRREKLENERQKHIEMKLEKERKKLEYERKMIEKEKLELLRYKRKLLGKEKENSRDDNKRRRTPDKFERKKYAKIEEHQSKHVSTDMVKEFWKNDNLKSSSSHDIYKKTNQEICVAPPPPVLSSNYHPVPQRPRSPDRERTWFERKQEYDVARQKPFGRKTEESRGYNVPSDSRQLYQEKPYTKEQYNKYKDYNLVQQHSWDGYSTSSYKEQKIPVVRTEPPRSVHQVRQQNYQGNSYGGSSQDFYASSNYRRVNDYYNRQSERKY